MLLAGTTRREGWKTLDSKGSVDYLATVPPLPDAVKAVKWDEIELIHGINVLYPWEAEMLLREIREALTPDGLLVLEQPNFHIASAEEGIEIKVSRGDLQRELENPAKADDIARFCRYWVEWTYGDPRFSDPSHMVKWGYTPQSLSVSLSACGFTRQDLKAAQHHIPVRDFRIEARP